VMIAVCSLRQQWWMQHAYCLRQIKGRNPP
jgi:hypothetical protein